MQSTIDVDPDCLAEIVPMLKQFGIRIIGSDWSEGTVCLAIEGDIVPSASKVTIEIFVTTGSGKGNGSTVATMTAVCRDVAETQQVEGPPRV